jgi:hypothetical protein
MGYLIRVSFSSRVGYLAKEVLNKKRGSITQKPQAEVGEAGNPTKKGHQEVVGVEPTPTLLLLLALPMFLALLMQKLLLSLNLEVLWQCTHNHSTPRRGHWKLAPLLKILLHPAVHALLQAVRTVDSIAHTVGSTAAAAGSSTGCKPRIGRRCRLAQRQGLQLRR